ncbi:lipase family protein [Myceligenerans pegani]|uniref:Triacylglycerol lipase n=1 Tax=Myceligenerans pegani TaxID=2776917 RepID=A0ABR9N0Q7_9MICO|nr:lipase family protein [Myceligenerans sp. TRM 65318]MBE1877250.1 triacylglycerol lipase [Myceligenerans sp. TRM 65318]MBE3019521.1 triacylglycerol lipase [Myceligenerans sp. TRM 65318]
MCNRPRLPVRTLRLRGLALTAVAALTIPLVPAVAQAGVPTSPAPAPRTSAAVPDDDGRLRSGTIFPVPPDDFYDPPADLGDGADGEVIRTREQATGLSARTWMVMYHSTNATGQDIPVTGRVLVPHRAWRGEGPRPIVTVAPGTRGVGDDCAPSRWLDYERPLVEPFLLQGYAVVITDYEGLGTPGVHTYMVGRSQGRVVLDMVRAATNLPAAGLDPGGKVAVVGYSQGGGAAVWAAELWREHAPELDVVGVAAGGVPADLTAVSERLNGGVGFGFMLLAAFGYDAAYPELDLRSYLNERGRRLYEREQDACVDTALAYALQDIDVYADQDPRYTEAWQARFTENRAGANPPDAPLFLYHGLFDEIVPPGQAVALREEYCAAGADVRWRWHLGEHVTTMVTAAPSVVSFVDRRFRDRPFRPTC